MKIIISRKGFDAQNGGTASPIMPDGTILSFPIPQNDGCLYEDISYKGMTYKEIWSQLKPKQKCFESGCHLDPDIRKNVGLKRNKNWVPIFGQCNAAQTHLENQGVTIGDLFLFFGWFRKTEDHNGVLRYQRGSKDVHVLFGYLQIGKIARNDETLDYPWHPHSRYRGNNTMYIAADHLVIDGVDTGLPGAGTFKYSDKLVLTMPGMPKSRWLLPDFFREVNISYHSQRSFKPEGYFQSVRIRQEFVVSEDERVTDWAKKIILDNVEKSKNK